MKHFLLLLFLSIKLFAFSQDLPVEIVYKNPKVVETKHTFNTIAGIRMKFTTHIVDAGQKIQTFCNFGNPTATKYDSVHVTASISCVKDSADILKTAIYKNFLQKINASEKYAASNNYKLRLFRQDIFTASTTPSFRECFRKMKKTEILSSGTSMDMYLRSDFSTENPLDTRVLLRENILLRKNGKFLDADADINGIEEIKKLLEEWYNDQSAISSGILNLSFQEELIIYDLKLALEITMGRQSKYLFNLSPYSLNNRKATFLLVF